MIAPIILTAVEFDNLDTVCFRGSAPLSALARISQADIFDQVLNPDGLQRDLSRKHAVEAYEYVARARDDDRPRAFPEVVLNVRDRKVLKVNALIDAPVPAVELVFDAAKIANAKTVKVSRVDGNHRLHYGAGDGKDRSALEVPVPFQIHVGLTREQEGALFLDINAEQKGLNTSHLHVLRSKLTSEAVELELHPERAFARWLSQDEVSPWNGLVFLGGSKRGSKQAGEIQPVSFVALESGVRRLLRGEYVSTVTDPRGQYTLIRAYWQAIKAAHQAAWDQPRDFLVLKNIGIQALSTLGVKVLNRSIMVGEVEPDDMLKLVQPAMDALDWSKDSPQVAGMSGNRAALILSGAMEQKLPALVVR